MSTGLKSKSSKYLLIGLLLGILLASPLYYVYAASLTFTTVIENGSLVTDASYIIFADGSSFYARNGRTGAIDYTSSSATTLLVNVLTASSSGDMIYVKSGTYPIKDIDIIKSIKICGESMWGTKFIPDSGASYLFNLPSGITEVSFSDFELDGQLTPNLSGIKSSSSSYIYHFYFTNLNIRNFLYYGMFPTHVSNVWMENCWFINSSLNAQYLSDWHIDGCFFHGASASATAYTRDYIAKFIGATNIRIDSSLFESSMDAKGLAFEQSVRCSILNNHMINVSTAIYLLDSTYMRVALNHEHYCVSAFLIEAGSSNYNEITENILETPLPITIVGSHSKVFENIGFITENWGILSSIANASYVAHGLTGAPTGIIITLSTYGAYAWVGNSNSTYFQVCSNKDTISGSWYAEYKP